MGRRQRTGHLRRISICKAEDAAKLNVVVERYHEYCAPRKDHIMAALKLQTKKEAKLGVVVGVQIKAQTSKTPKRNLRKEKKDQIRKTSVGGVVTTRPTGTVQQWDNRGVSPKR